MLARLSDKQNGSTENDLWRREVAGTASCSRKLLPSIATGDMVLAIDPLYLYTSLYTAYKL